MKNKRVRPLAGPVLLAIAAILLCSAVSNRAQESTAKRRVSIVMHGGYPELHVDGAPFFIHSAAFFYYRIPRDQWSFLLDRYQKLGINTIDIYIP